MGIAVEFENVSKHYKGTNNAATNKGGVSNLSIQIPDGQFTSILGGSGSGKTTTLRLIAGLLQPDSGCISIDSAVVAYYKTFLPANQRDLAMVFQSYALWPHLNVFENVAFGLRVRKMARTTITAMVTEMLALVGMLKYANRRPGELSGGQQQRVALARSLVLKPKLLLLDEPLSNLDAELRVQMRAQLKHLQRTTGVTFVYVTHDQEEALALSDYLIVLKDGAILQQGTPSEVYLDPHNALVAKIVSNATLVSGQVGYAANGEIFVETVHDETNQFVRIFGRLGRESTVTEGVKGYCIVRSEAVNAVAPLNHHVNPSKYNILGRVRSVSFIGRANRVEVSIGTDITFVVYDYTKQPLTSGEEVLLTYDPMEVLVLEG